LCITGSLPAWGEWIEIHPLPEHEKQNRSLPAWGEWIEIDVAGALDFEGARAAGYRFPED